jgi:NUMOD3 motif
MHKGFKHSEETRRKMSLAKQQMSESTKKKISRAQKGKVMSEEARKKISEAIKRSNRNAETKSRRTAALKKWTAERTKGQMARNAAIKAAVCAGTASLSEIGARFGISKQRVFQIIRGGR